MLEVDMLPPKEQLRGDMRRRIEIVEHLRMVRQLAGLTQRELALRMGKAPSAVAVLETSPNWSIHIFHRWVHALGLKVTYTLNGLPPLDTTDPFVAAALERPSDHPLSQGAWAAFLLSKQIEQICTARRLTSPMFHRDSKVADLQRTARWLGGYLTISMGRE